MNGKQRPPKRPEDILDLVLPPPEVARALRVRAGLMIDDIAEVCGTSRSAVSRWERGERTPSRRHRFLYARTLRALGWDPKGPSIPSSISDFPVWLTAHRRFFPENAPRDQIRGVYIAQMRDRRFTFAEIGEELRVTGNRVRQILQKAKSEGWVVEVEG